MYSMMSEAIAILAKSQMLLYYLAIVHIFGCVVGDTAAPSGSCTSGLLVPRNQQEILIGAVGKPRSIEHS